VSRAPAVVAFTAGLFASLAGCVAEGPCEPGLDGIRVTLLGDADTPGTYEVVVQNDGRTVVTCVVDVPVDPLEVGTGCPSFDASLEFDNGGIEKIVLNGRLRADTLGFEVWRDGTQVVKQTFEPDYDAVLDHECSGAAAWVELELDWEG